MKTFQSFIPALGVFALVNAGYYVNASSEAVKYTTITTDIYTTVCPSPTEVTQGSKTYTVTAPTTLTITDCPCTVTQPVSSVPVTQLVSSVPVTQLVSSVPVPISSSVPSSPPKNATIPAWTTVTVDTYVTVCPTPTTFTAGMSTYTVTESTLITITNCPCTISYSATPITTTATTTVSMMTTYCPTPIAITTAGTTYSATTPGYISIPVVSVTTYVVPAPAPTTPITLSPENTPDTYYTSPVVVPSSTKATTSAPAQVTFNAADNLRGGIGAIVAGGLAALLL